MLTLLTLLRPISSYVSDNVNYDVPISLKIWKLEVGPIKLKVLFLLIQSVCLSAQ